MYVPIISSLAQPDHCQFLVTIRVLWANFVREHSYSIMWQAARRNLIIKQVIFGSKERYIHSEVKAFVVSYSYTEPLIG